MTLQLRAWYDIPEEVAHGPHSPAFERFLRHWFVDGRALTRGEADLSFLDDLTLEETERARDLLRRNLDRKETHIIDGVAI